LFGWGEEQTYWMICIPRNGEKGEDDEDDGKNG